MITKTHVFHAASAPCSSELGSLAPSTEIVGMKQCIYMQIEDPDHEIDPHHQYRSIDIYYSSSLQTMPGVRCCPRHLHQVSAHAPKACSLCLGPILLGQPMRKKIQTKGTQKGTQSANYN